MIEARLSLTSTRGTTMEDTKTPTQQETTEVTLVQNGFPRTHLGRWGSLALLAGMVFMLHGVVFSTLDEVAPIGSGSTNTEITIVVEPVPIPMQIMADAR